MWVRSNTRTSVLSACFQNTTHPEQKRCSTLAPLLLSLLLLLLHHYYGYYSYCIRIIITIVINSSNTFSIINEIITVITSSCYISLQMLLIYFIRRSNITINTFC